MVNVVGEPVQGTPENVNVGVAVMVAVTALFVLLDAAKEEISPEPEPASPIEG